MNRVKICDVAPIKQSSENLDSEKVWLLNLDMIESDSGKVIDFQYFDKDELGNSISKFDNENVLYSKLRPYLNKVVVPEQPGFCTSELVTFRPLKNILDRYYFSAFLRSRFFVEYINSKSSGAKMPRANMDALKNAYIPLPPLPEQQKIAHHLDTIQSAIDNKKQQLSQLDELVKSKFVEMFGDENSIHNWNCVKVEDVAKVSVGIVVKPTQYYTNSGIKAFRSLNIGELHINDSDWVYLTKEGNEKNKKSIIHKDDVLVVRTGNPGISCVVPEEYDGCNAIDIIIARPNKKIINSVYLSAFTSFPHGMIQIFDNMTGVAQKHFNVGRYQSMDIALPPIELQNTFAQYVQKIDAAKSIIKTQLVDLQELLDSKMDEYFGE